MSSFEQALYRVYERSLDTLHNDQPCIADNRYTKPSSICHVALHSIWALAITFLCITSVLHYNFVGDPGCLKTTLDAAVRSSTTNQSNGTLSSRFLPVDVAAASTTKSETRIDGDGKEKDSLYLGKDEVMKIKIIPLGGLMEEEKDGDNIFADEEKHQGGDNGPGRAQGGKTNKSLGYSDIDADYIFVRDMPLLYLTPEFWSQHQVKLINVTMDEICVTKSVGLSWLLTAMNSVETKYDTVIINQLMYTLRGGGEDGGGGALRNLKTNETWSWSKDLLPPEGGYNVVEAIGRKVLTLLQSLLAFILTSAVTSLICRVLMSSGVVLMFPIFYLLRSAGCRLDLHLLTLSYPWLGVPMEQLRARNKPVLPFILAHLTHVIVYYMMYEACQIFWADVLYSKSVPSGLQFQVYGIFMLWEYFSMIFLRSALGIRYFPRITLLYILMFHFYLYETPYGFFNEFLLAVFMLLLHAMIYTLLFLELSASRRGDITFEQPRAMSTDLGYAALPSALPPSWSLFLPPNVGGRRGVYEEVIPQRPTQRGGGGAAGGGGRVVMIEIDGLAAAGATGRGAVSGVSAVNGNGGEGGGGGQEHENGGGGEEGQEEEEGDDGDDASPRGGGGIIRGETRSEGGAGGTAGSRLIGNILGHRYRRLAQNRGSSLV